MKKLLFFFVCTCIFFSCSQDEMVNPIIDSAEFSEESLSDDIELRSYASYAPYAVSAYIYANAAGTDYYVTLSNTGNTMNVKGSTYYNQGSRFKLLPQAKPTNSSVEARPIYRYYTPSGKKHRLSLMEPDRFIPGGGFYDDYVYDGIVGYVQPAEHIINGVDKDKIVFLAEYYNNTIHAFYFAEEPTQTFPNVGGRWQSYNNLGYGYK